jgi:hypothetical protein
MCSSIARGLFCYQNQAFSGDTHMLSWWFCSGKPTKKLFILHPFRPTANRFAAIRTCSYQIVRHHLMAIDCDSWGYQHFLDQSQMMQEPHM